MRYGPQLQGTPSSPRTSQDTIATPLPGPSGLHGAAGGCGRTHHRSLAPNCPASDAPPAKAPTPGALRCGLRSNLKASCRGGARGWGAQARGRGPQRTNTEVRGLRAPKKQPIRSVGWTPPNPRELLNPWLAGVLDTLAAPDTGGSRGAGPNLQLGVPNLDLAGTLSGDRRSWCQAHLCPVGALGA